MIVGDDGTSNPYKIQFKDGKLGGDFYKADVEMKLDPKVQLALTRCVIHFPRGLYGLSGPLTATEGLRGPLTATEGLRGPLTATEGLSGPLASDVFG